MDNDRWPTTASAEGGVTGLGAWGPMVNQLSVDNSNFIHVAHRTAGVGVDHVLELLLVGWFSFHVIQKPLSQLSSSSGKSRSI